MECSWLSRDCKGSGVGERTVMYIYRIDLHRQGPPTTIHVCTTQWYTQCMVSRFESIQVTFTCTLTFLAHVYVHLDPVKNVYVAVTQGYVYIYWHLQIRLSTATRIYYATYRSDCIHHTRLQEQAKAVNNLK